jgi:co-chaperonin GroES (HSP10)
MSPRRQNNFTPPRVFILAILIKLARPDERTYSGLYLPPGVQEKEKVQQGYVIKTGPGYAIPMPVDDEPWKQVEDQVKYVPLQVKEGDLAIFLLSGATEVIPIAIGMKMKKKLSFRKVPY